MAVFQPIETHCKVVPNARIAAKEEGTWRDPATGIPKPTRNLTVVYEGGTVKFSYRDDAASLAAWAAAPLTGRFDVVAEIQISNGKEYPKPPQFHPVGSLGLRLDSPPAKAA